MDMTTIFCHQDDFCKLFEKEFENQLLTNGRNIRKRKRSLKLSEIMTITTYYHYSSYKTFKDYYTKSPELKSAFALPSYNRFIELKQKVVIPMAVFARIQSLLSECDGISFIDSFPLAVSHVKRISSHKTFSKIAARGKTSVGWFYGFKLHLVINGKGEIINFTLTPGNVADNNAAVLDQLLKNVTGKVYGDKGYLVNQELFQKLYENGVQLVTRIKKNMKNKFMDINDKYMLKKRGVIESVGGFLKKIFNIEHSRYRSTTSFLVNVCAALSAYSMKEKKPSIYRKKRHCLQDA